MRESGIQGFLVHLKPRLLWEHKRSLYQLNLMLSQGFPASKPLTSGSGPFLVAVSLILCVVARLAASLVLSPHIGGSTCSIPTAVTINIVSIAKYLLGVRG